LSTVEPWRFVKNRLENTVVIVLLLLACGTGVAWVYSDVRGWQRTWSDSGKQTCGRLASVHGRILWQRCDLGSSVPLPAPVSGWRLTKPDDFVVGTNPAGERLVVDCDGIAVPFTLPQPDLIISVQDRFTASTDGAKQTRWSAKWREVTVAYWLALVLLLLFPVRVGLRRLYRRIWPGRELRAVEQPQQPGVASGRAGNP
jgi:hypothetical protein